MSTLSPLLSISLFLPLALALGFKHAFDADHLLAVSNFMTRSRRISQTSRMALSWAAGHMVTSSGLALLLFAWQVEFITIFLRQAELAVAIMLILIGILGILVELPIIRSLRHDDSRDGAHSRPYEEKAIFYPALLGVGVVHGLASNDELFTLFVVGLQVQSLVVLLGGIATFSLGVILGMMAFGVMLTYPLLKRDIKRVRLVIHAFCGSLSILYGLMMMVGIDAPGLAELL